MFDEQKEMLILVGGILLFFGMLFGAAVYDSSVKYECRVKAMEKNMTASDIQAVCK